MTRGTPGKQARNGITGRWNSMCKDSKASNSTSKTRALEREAPEPRWTCGLAARCGLTLPAPRSQWREGIKEGSDRITLVS